MPFEINEELFSHLHSAVILLDAQIRVRSMNPAAERLLGISFKSAEGKTFGELWEDPQEKLTALLHEALKTGRTIKIHELEIVTQDKTLTLQVEMAPLGVLENPRGLMLWLEERSLAQALQEENRVLDRLAMMGTIASGLAHEIRNPLGGIRAAAQMCSRESPESQEYADMITAEVDRLNELITELLNFSKPKRIKKSPVNVHKILSELFKLQKEIFKKQNIKLVQHFDPSLPPVHGHGPSLKQALLNLIKNALEAIDENGTLTVSTQVHTQTRVLTGKNPSGAMAEITIQDTGPGIPKKNLESLFTPFFTTKHQGTGLGLMMVQRILKEHHGSLKVESEVGQGSTFRVFLKLATDSGND